MDTKPLPVSTLLPLPADASKDQPSSRRSAATPNMLSWMTEDPVRGETADALGEIRRATSRKRPMAA
jgi:hypothetical protein